MAATVGGTTLIRIAALLCTSALTATLLVAGPTSTASVAAPSGGAGQLVQTFKVDVDGDGRTDTVKAYRKAPGRYQIRLRTARGKTATKDVSADPISGRPLYAAASLDQVKGRELILTRGDGDGWEGYVLTLRKGKLVSQAAPAGYDVAEGSYFRRWAIRQPTYVLGFRFFTKGGKRYCDTTWYDLGTDGDRYTGSVVRSVWQGGAWKRMSRKAATPLDYDSAMRQDGFRGVHLTRP